MRPRRVVDAALTAAATIERLDRRPILALLVVIQWAVIAALGFGIKHNGWLFHHGGDGTYYWTTTWAVAHRWLPETVISYGLPVFLWPLGLVFGTSLPAALPAIVILQVALLAPLGVIAFYGLAERIGGRLFGYAATLMWVLSPLVVLRYLRPDFRADFRTYVLPGALGLTNLGDYPSMILAVVVAWLVLRAIDENRWNDVLLAGLVCGLMIGVKPSNGYFVLAPVAALLVARRAREAGAFLLALVPALVTLTIWKAVGLGNVPLLGAATTHAAGADGVAVASAGSRISTYIPFDWHTFETNLAQLREYAWSLRFAEWLAIAGVVGALRRGRPHAVLLGVWAAAFLILKGGAEGRSSVVALSFFRLTMPGFPAYVLLAACTIFLVPGLGRRRRASDLHRQPVRWSRGLVGAAVVLAAYPLAVVAMARAAPAAKVAKKDPDNLLVPIATSLTPSATRVGRRTLLRWTPPRRGDTSVSYIVFRDRANGCRIRAEGARDCMFDMAVAAVVTATSWSDARPGAWYYRVGVVADPLARPLVGDLIMLSPAVRSA